MSRNSLPSITDKYLRKAHREIKEGAVEGQIPPDNRTVTLAPGYVMNILGEITTEDERPLVLNKQKDGFPFLAIMDGSGKLEKIYVADAMRENFGSYIEGYVDTRFTPEDYTLAPKNGDRSNFMLTNLQFVKRHPHIVEPTQVAILDIFNDHILPTRASVYSGAHSDSVGLSYGSNQ